MKTSIMSDKIKSDNDCKNTLKYLAAVAFWIMVWFVAAISINKQIIIVTPAKVLRTLFSLVRETAFWSVVGFSFLRIAGGFFCAMLAGIVFAVLSYAVPFVRILLAPLVSAVKSVPVASFVILALLWINSSYLSVFISFLMVFPVIYTNVLNGVVNTDRKLLEMAEVFRISRIKRILYIYVPDVMPYFVSACTVSLGLCWKSGVAAEVIGQPTGSIGEKLYMSKIYLETAELFSWTIVIVLISFLFEKLFLFLVKRLWKEVERSSMK